jgi:hypothetical protein
MKDTNDEKDNWFHYVLHGVYSIELDIAYDAEEDDIVHIRASSPLEHEERIIVAMDCILWVREGAATGLR